MGSREIQAILKQLPDKDVIEIDSLLKAKAFDGVDTIAPQKMRLYYNPRKDADKYNLSDSKLRYITVQNDDGNIDKKGIESWLNKICDYYKGKNN